MRDAPMIHGIIAALVVNKKIVRYPLLPWRTLAPYFVGVASLLAAVVIWWAI